MSTLRTRIAPTPSGYLHPGNGVSFIMTWAIARAKEGQILLRIDDLDKSRFRQEYLDDIFFTLDWLGLDYDEGPSGSGDFMKHWTQHLRLAQYNLFLEELRQKNFLFACDCSRKLIREQSTNGLYPGTCRNRNLSFDEDVVAWRVKMSEKEEVHFEDWQDGTITGDMGKEARNFFVRQKNKQPAYQIRSLADDLAFNINFIVRGLDLRSSTFAQQYLARLLGKDVFSEILFWHHDLLKTASGEKLSKSKGADSIKSMRELSRSSKLLFQQAGQWLGLKDNIREKEELLDLLKNKFLFPQKK